MVVCLCIAVSHHIACRLVLIGRFDDVVPLLRRAAARPAVIRSSMQLWYVTFYLLFVLTFYFLFVLSLFVCVCLLLIAMCRNC